MAVTILGTLVVTHGLRFLKALLLWPPRYAWQTIKSAGRHLLVLGKAKDDPLAATGYVGRQLSLLAVYLAAIIALGGVIETMQVLDPSWSYASHRWIVGAVGFFMVIFALRSGLIVFWLYVLCEMIVNPPKPNKEGLKIGPVTLFPPQPGRARPAAQPAEVSPAAASVTLEQTSEPDTSAKSP